MTNLIHTAYGTRIVYDERNDCPQCGRPTGLAAYICLVPGCLKTRFCCAACILEHMGEHVRERDKKITMLRIEIEQLYNTLSAPEKETPCYPHL